MMKLIKVLILFLILFQTSCLTITQIQPARVLEKDQNYFAISGGTYSSEYVAAGESSDYSYPIVEAMFRRGVHENIDVGARLTNFATLILDGKYQFIKSEFDLSTGLAFGYVEIKSGDYSTKIYDLKIPLYMGYNFNEFLTLLLTPAVSDRLVVASTTSTETENWVLVGGSTGIKLGKKWGLIAEAGFAKPIAGADDDNEKKLIKQYSGSLFFTWK